MRAVATRLGCLAAMMMFIALLCVPTQANAHAGHSHAVAVPVAEETVEADLEAVSDLQPAVQALVSAHDGNSNAPVKCLGGCCSSASHACCAFVLPGRSDDGGLVFVSERVHDATSLALLDHRPSVRGKPPKFFA
jgi:hypothetical protein